MSNYYTKKDKIIDGLTSYYFVDKCQQSDNLPLEQRLEKVDELLQHEYWDKYYENYYENETKGNKTDYLAEQSAVQLNLEKMANYLLFAKDAERVTKKTDYIILKNRKAFDEYLDKEDISNHSKETLVTYLENKQYYLETNLKFKKSMLNLPVSSEYKKFYTQVCDFDGTYTKVKNRLIEEKNNLIADNSILSGILWEEGIDRSKMCPIRKAQLHMKISENKSKINENIRKIKTILFWYKKYRQTIEQDVVDLEHSLRPRIYFKHVGDYLYTPEILNFFDYFDITSDFDNQEILELLVKVGSTNEKENVVSELLFKNSVYEGIEAMDVIRKLINYYLDEIVKDEHERLIFDMWRNGNTQEQISEIVRNNKVMSTRNIGHIIYKILRNIQKKHNENIIHVYETTKKPSSLRTCNICGNKFHNSFFNKNQYMCKSCQVKNVLSSKKCKKCGMTKMPHQFSKDLRNSDGLRSWCKECRKKDASDRRKVDDI